jgi:NAD(P)-dependent dehydrogenase (short-subunit alcohol dehydrogenase family)
MSPTEPVDWIIRMSTDGGGTAEETTLSSLFSLKERTAVVTGGTRGIGELAARGLLLAGARVLIVGRSATTSQDKAQELSQFGTCEAITADLATPDGISALGEAVDDRCDGVNILVNNAGTTGIAPLDEYPAEYWDSVLGLNLKAPFVVLQALLPQLRKAATPERPSHVINTGSTAGLATRSSPTTPDNYAYSASKAALHFLTKQLAQRLAPEHIYVNAFAPGLFPTDLSRPIMDNPDWLQNVVARTPAGRVGAPNDVAALIVSIASSSFMVGNIIPLDGGYSIG